MSRADRILILFLAASALIAWPIAAAVGSGGVGRVVVSGPAGVTAVSLSEAAALEVQGALGPVGLVVSDGSIRVSKSGCPDRVCVLTGAVSRPGEVIACVPNRVAVRVEGQDGDGYDAHMR